MKCCLGCGRDTGGDYCYRCVGSGHQIVQKRKPGESRAPCVLSATALFDDNLDRDSTSSERYHGNTRDDI